MENTAVTNPVSVTNAAAAAVTTIIPDDVEDYDDDDDDDYNNNKFEISESFPYKLTSENQISNGVMRATVALITSITPNDLNCYLEVNSKR